MEINEGLVRDFKNENITHTYFNQIKRINMIKCYNKRIGSVGEDLAEIILKSKGYEILERNYRTKLGEIDLIGIKNGILTFVEVKTRSSTNFGEGKESIDYNKMKHIRNASNWYIKDLEYLSKTEGNTVEYREIEFQVFNILAEHIEGITI